MLPKSCKWWHFAYNSQKDLAWFSLQRGLDLSALILTCLMIPRVLTQTNALYLPGKITKVLSSSPPHELICFASSWSSSNWRWHAGDFTVCLTSSWSRCAVLHKDACYKIIVFVFYLLAFFFIIWQLNALILLIIFKPVTQNLLHISYIRGK